MHFRWLAAVGLPAHLVDRFASFLLGLVGIRLPVVPILIVVLGAMAGIEAYENYRELAERPEPREATVAEIVKETERGQIIWLTFTGEVAAEPFIREVPLAETGVLQLGSRIYFYYLALDPDDPGVGLIVRTLTDDDHFRTRLVAARLVEDPAFVAAALGRLELPDGIEVDALRYLDEQADVPPGQEPLEPGQLAELVEGGEVTVIGRIPAPIRAAACAPPAAETDCAPADPAARWVYLLADPTGEVAFVLRSPHAPDAIPVPLDGLVLTDTFRTAPVVESDWLADLREDLRYPRQRVLFHGAEPPFRDPDWTGLSVMGGASLLLLVSALIGYPIFRRTLTPAQAAPLSAGESLQVEMHGRLAAAHSRSAVDGALGAIERMSLPGLVLALWRYGYAERGESRREIEERVSAEARGRETRLVVHAPARSQLAVLGERPARLETGTVYRVTNSRPALRLEDGHVDLLLIFEGDIDRDRAAVDISREAAEQ